MKRSKLYLFTFIGILLSLLISGIIAAPLVMNYVRNTYINLQIDVNMRQANNMAKILSSLLEQGESKADVINYLQESVLGSDTDRGYLCMIESSNGELLCHPDFGLVGQPIAPMGQVFKDVLKPEKGESSWISRIEEKKSSGGLIMYPDGNVEIDYFTPVEGTDWILSSHENTMRVDGEISIIQNTILAGFGVLGILIAFPASWAARRVSRRYEKSIIKEQERSESLLLNILPAPIASRLKNNEEVIADSFENVTVLFADIVGFTTMTKNSDPSKVVSLLNYLFTAFDNLAVKYGLEKIKTIGDAWMAASGLPIASDHDPSKVAMLALEMQSFIKKHFHDKNQKLYIRIGIHTGPAAAGVVGKTKFAYDLWGETVNRASRLESSSEKNKIHVSKEFANALNNNFNLDLRGSTELKGLGKHETYYLLS